MSKSYLDDSVRCRLLGCPMLFKQGRLFYVPHLYTSYSANGLLTIAE